MAKINDLAKMLLDWPRPARKLLVFALDLFICIATAWLAFALRIGEWDVRPIRLLRL